MFGVLEAASLDTSNTLADTLLKTMEAGFQLCLEMGAPEFTLEDFYEVMVEQLTWIREEHPSSDEIAERFRDQYVSDYAVFYARAMVAGYLRKNKDMFAPYIDQSIDTFIRSSVEPMNTDADYVQCVALANTLNIGVRIMYVDQAPGNLNSHTFPEGATPLVFLLYRPGHYDVLYSKQKEGKTDATGSKTDAGASTEKTIETDTSGGGTDTGTNTETEKKDETDTSGERGTSDDRDNDNKVEDRADGTNDATCVLSGAVASLYLDE